VIAFPPAGDHEAPDSPPTLDIACRACGDAGNMERVDAREMMFGTRESFAYGLCGSCGSLSIADVPGDLARHYPATYYADRGGTPTPQDGPIRRWAIRTLVERRLFGYGRPWLPLARRLATVPRTIRQVEPVVRYGGLTSVHAAIADVGCTPRPHRLALLRRLGFTHLTGIEPYLDADRRFQGVSVRRGELADVDGRFDLIMFHHSLEHVADPSGVLRDARDRLRAGGRVLVRTPIMGGYPWRTWGTDWVELDAPRHLVVFSLDGLRRAALAAGFEISHVEWESGAWEGIASDQYRRDIAMYEPGSWFVERTRGGFDEDRIAEFRALASTLAGTSDAGRAAVWLRPVAREASTSVSAPIAQASSSGLTDSRSDPA
jgi:SAM-dependent methyltransferase